MKFFLLDNVGEGCGVDLALRAQDAGHTVRYYCPGKGVRYGDGMLDKVDEWEGSMDWAELIVTTGNAKLGRQLEPYFKRGCPIFGPNEAGAELELDRELGQRILKENGVPIAPYTTVNDLDDAIELVEQTGKAYAIKPWGGESDKSMTCIAATPEEAIFMLELWKQRGLKGKLMLQEKVKGVEIGIAGWFGKAGWLTYVEESFEHKKFMNDDLGCNTGEMGTVIRHVKKSKLFDLVLAPVTDYLSSIRYVGDCSVNCIVDPQGIPRPLEFTTRLGWPDFCIRQAVLLHQDPIQWMADALQGKDTFSPTEDVAAGVLICHGDFPKDDTDNDEWTGFPIQGIKEGNIRNVHFQQAMEGRMPKLRGGVTRRAKVPVTAGTYVLVASGSGPTVTTAVAAAYKVAWSLSMPSNLMMRTDIGQRLKKDLPELQKFGFAEGMKWA